MSSYLAQDHEAATGELARIQLDRVCAGARRALGCRLVVVRGLPGSNGVLEVTGSSVADRPLIDAMTGHSRVDVFGETSDVAPEQVGAYVTLASMQLDTDGPTMGSMYALGRPGDPPVDEAVFRAFGAHAGSVVRHPRTVAAPPEGALSLIDDVVLSGGTFAELLAELKRTLALLTGCTRVGLMIWDDDRKLLRTVAGSWGADDELTASLQVRQTDFISNTARVFLLGVPYVNNAAERDPGQRQEFRSRFGFSTLLSVPLKMAGRSIGVLHLSDKPGRFSPEDLRIAVAVAPRLSQMVELTRRLMNVRREQQLESIVSRVATTIAERTSSDELLLDAVEGLRRVMEAAIVAFVPEQGNPIVAKVAGLTVRTEREVIAAAANARERGLQFVQPSGAGDPGSVTFEVPVRLGARLVGGVSARRAGAEPFSHAEQKALLNMASLTALSWATERYQQQRAMLARLEERERIADDLHDDVAQFGYAAQLHLETALEGVQDPLARDELARVKSLLVRQDAVVRNLIQMIAPPVSRDVALRLLEIVNDIEEDYGVVVEFEMSVAAATATAAMRSTARALVVRTARETLVNAVKHAAPTRLQVECDVRKDRQLWIRVSDDGCGDHATATGEPSYGLASLRSSAARHQGTLRVTKRAAGGTSVTLRLPL